MPASRFSHTVTVTRPAPEVWVALQHADTWRGIGPVEEVWDAEHDDRGVLMSYRWSAHAGPGRWEGISRTTEAVPPERLEMAIRSSEMTGTLTTALAPNGRETAVTVTLAVEAVGMLATLFWGVVKEAIRKGLPRQVEAFGRRLQPE